MNKRIFILMKNDLVNYPPMISLLRVMAETDLEIHYIGVYSDAESQNILTRRGVHFSTIELEHTGSLINKSIQQRRYKNGVEKILIDHQVTKDDLIWYVYSNTAYFLASMLKKYKYVVHFYEFMNPQLGIKYHLLYPGFSMKELLANAAGVIHCEYNRAQITKGLYSLKKSPYIIPNKPYFDDNIINNTPKDLQQEIDNIQNKLQGKFVILYQGIFHPKERRLEEFCDAMDLLPDNFMLVAMGSGGEYYKQLKEKYESGKIMFLPFFRPPYHLLITKLASVGILTYHPTDSSYAGVINPLYCAPNKIFEYGKYSVPMISNDIPGLKYIFDKYNCGLIVPDPMDSKSIADTILSLSTDANNMRNGAKRYYDSVDIKKTILDIVEELRISK